MLNQMIEGEGERVMPCSLQYHGVRARSMELGGQGHTYCCHHSCLSLFKDLLARRRRQELLRGGEHAHRQFGTYGIVSKE